MLTKVYIDGQEGTTGLKIFERFQNRTDIEIIKIIPELRKDLAERKKMINQSDYTFLCLPDVASIEAVSLIENSNVKIIDASTAHRTNPDWAYGFPELSPDFRNKIEKSSRVAVPGCYATGFTSIVYPLIKLGIISTDYPITSHGISGYSGGGKSMIEEYESGNKPLEYFSPRLYGLNGNHKHLNEMQIISGLDYKPCFNPIVDDYYNGMVVCVPLTSRLLCKKISAIDIHTELSQYYKDEFFVNVMPFQSDGFLGANNLANSNYLQIYVSGNDDRVLLSARLDNLSKGASGAAIQCMNIMMNIDEKISLI